MSYSEVFTKLFPYYLAIGMTPEQYWDMDASLAKAYRLAYQQRLDMQNQILWLQGQYIYDALCEVSPIYSAFAKNGTKPVPYNDKPYPLAHNAKREEKTAEKKTYDKNKAYMEAFAEAFNKKFKERK